MSKSVTINARYRVTDGILKGFVGKCFAADFTPNSIYGHSALLEIDNFTSVLVDPKNIEKVVEPDSIDFRQILLGDLEPKK